MNFPFWIARRYFKSRKKRSFINIISVIAMLGVGIGTMALVVVLSVFNGMEELNHIIFKSFDADLKILSKEGKRLNFSDNLLKKIKQNAYVQVVVEVIEDNALAVYGDSRAVVKLKGVSQDFLSTDMLKTAIVEGQRELEMAPHSYAIVGSDIQNALGISTKNIFTPLELWYPNNSSKTINLNSPDAFNQQILGVSGVFMLDARFDNHIFAPLSVVKNLLGYKENQLSALEIILKPDVEAENVQEKLQETLGENVRILTRNEQNADLLRAIRIEKLFVTIALGLIILVAAVNIFFSLSMLVLEKKAEISMLRAMGASPQDIKQIFMFEGALVAFSGALVGLILGVLLCVLQQNYGLVSLGMANAVVDAYPVKLIWQDLTITAILVIFVTLAVSYLPAQRATQKP